MELDQVLLVDKPAGITSFGVVARIRRVVQQKAKDSGWVGKRYKVGHTGTLDPFATGLMIILTGKETKNASKYSKLDKVYETTIELGKTSTTADSDGVISKVERISRPTIKKVETVLSSFIGEIEQTPPIYSAIKINGQRAYKLAYQGKSPKMPKRKVNIYDLGLLEYKYPFIKFRTHVSSGTYIRSLAEDIGKKLGTGAYVTSLRRIKVGNFDIENATKLLLK